MTVAQQFGISEQTLAGAGSVSYPPTVKGRVAQIDADFMCYQVSAPNKEEREGGHVRSFDTMCQQARTALMHLMNMVGAENYIAHLTPSGSNKGGRYEQSITLPYQGNRIDAEKPEHSDALRAWIGKHLPAFNHVDQEADDGMAQANYAAMNLNASDIQTSIIVSRDKDLRMVPGLHWDFKEERIVTIIDRFGYIEIDESGSQKKLVGYGTKFFWAQLLMGDGTDNIKGLPHMTTRFWFDDMGHETAAWVKLCDRYRTAKTNADKERHGIALSTAGQKLRPVGPVAACDILKHCESNRDCYHRIKGLYLELDHNANYEFINHHTQEPCTATQALFGDMQTLWMRRSKDPMDVLAWLKEEGVL